MRNYNPARYKDDDCFNSNLNRPAFTSKADDQVESDASDMDESDSESDDSGSED